MDKKLIVRWILFLALLSGFIGPAAVEARAVEAPAAQAGEVTAFDLIIAMNTLRTSYGLPALVEDPIIDAVAQSTAEIMAANQMSWHIGDASGRLAGAGYGGGAKVWATENFAVGNMSIDEIMVVWSDASHMIPAVNPAYCNVGAGTAKSPNGMTYYVLQAAYTASKACGEYKSPVGTTTAPGGTTTEGRVPGVSQLIVPVKIATPDSEGKIFHEVLAGQSFWAIAVAYQITIRDIEIWNNISKESKLQIGQRLFIPGANTEGYATPTPVGMIQMSTPDAEGKVVHTVQSYQTLTTISQAYGITVDAILNMNGIQADWPLQIGQILLVSPGTITPSATPRPLSPIEKLTPASDGKYYHTVQSGETVSWIAGLYEVNMYDLMAWNGLDESSILQPEQKLILNVTPPATATFTAGPPTLTPNATREEPTPTFSPNPGGAEIMPTAAAASTPVSGSLQVIRYASIGLAAVVLGIVVFFMRRKK